MITTYKIPYRNGELRIGWASWDNGELKARSIKYAYPDSSGKISRGSPELPFDILVDMLMLATEQKELGLFDPSARQGPRDLDAMDNSDLHEEKKQLSVALLRLQQLAADLPWLPWERVYDPIGSRLELVREKIGACENPAN